LRPTSKLLELPVSAVLGLFFHVSRAISHDGSRTGPKVPSRGHVWPFTRSTPSAPPPLLCAPCAKLSPTNPFYEAAGVKMRISRIRFFAASPRGSFPLSPSDCSQDTPWAAERFPTSDINPSAAPFAGQAGVCQVRHCKPRARPLLSFLHPVFFFLFLRRVPFDFLSRRRELTQLGPFFPSC